MSNYHSLDLDVILANVASYTDIKEAKEYIINEEVIYNPLIIKKNNQETYQAIKLLQDGISVDFVGIKNVCCFLKDSKKGTILEGTQLYDILIFHNSLMRIKTELKDLDDNNCLRNYLDSIVLKNDVFKNIENAIEFNGEVKDNASVILENINNQLLIKQKQINDKAIKFINTNAKSLQEQVTYIRDNRITFLIKNQDKNKFKGLIYGSSSSGLAYYIEPDIFIELNNEINNLISLKKEEINNILKKLSCLVSCVSDEYIRNFDSIVKLSIIFSKAKYGFENNGIIAQLDNGHNFEFYDLVHPLLDKKKAVSNTYRLYEPYDGIVISGSNTGGKTVSLKAIGLSIIMSYLGIPIFASKAIVPFYKNVFIDIDDNQSIKDSLSTFSSHIKNINSILKQANIDSLILIDELISGTDPKQAQAISLAIMDKIKELKSKFIITTHFDEIKNYSYKDEHILLSAVGFDSKTLLPTYKYYENTIGSSNALEIASIYLDDKKIIENAINYLKVNQNKQEELLSKLAKQSSELEYIKNDLLIKQDELNQIKKSYIDKIEKFDNEKELLRKKYEDKLNDNIIEIKNKALSIIDNLSLNNKKESIEKIDSLIVDSKDSETVCFKLGDNVRIDGSEQVGTIEEIINDNVSVNINGIKIKTKIKNLILMPKIIHSKNKYIRPLNKRVSKELNLVGKRVEEGLIELESYLDDANGARLSKVKIIHGFGSGTLRKAIREKLKKLSYVNNFSDGDFYDGGSAVTIVEFKK